MLREIGAGVSRGGGGNRRLHELASETPKKCLRKNGLKGGDNAISLTPPLAGDIKDGREHLADTGIGHQSWNLERPSSPWRFLGILRKAEQQK